MIGPRKSTPALFGPPGVGIGKYRKVGVPVPVTVAISSGSISRSELVLRLFKPWIATRFVPTWRKPVNAEMLKSAGITAMESSRFAGAPLVQVATEGSGALLQATSLPLI